ncbi:MAG: hypothetical protein ACPG06_02485 [Alphaproteobacteria bacterium]
MNKRPSILFLSAFFVFAFFPAAQADDYLEATNALCEKIKSCAMAEMDVEAMPADQRAMMENMMAGMCANIQQNYTAAPGSPYYDDAAACMRSMAALSCTEFQEMDEENATAACKSFRAAASNN